MVVARRKVVPNIIRVACLLTDQVGNFVYVRNDVDGNGLVRVATCDTTTNDKMPAWGVIIKKWDFTQALVQTSGAVEGIYTGLEYRRVYWVGTDGKPTRPSPDATIGTGKSHTQAIGVALDANILELKLSPWMFIKRFP